MAEINFGELAGFMSGLLEPHKTASAAQAIKNFLHRQYHGFTGRVLGQSSLSRSQIDDVLRRIGSGEPGAAEALRRAATAGESTKLPTARLEAARKGVTDLPGVAKGLLTHPLRTMRLGWQSQGPIGKTVLVGTTAIPVAAMVKDKKKQRGREIGREIGGTAGLLAAGSLPIAPALAASIAAGQAGKYIGKLNERKTDVSTSDRD